MNDYSIRFSPKDIVVSYMGNTAIMKIRDCLSDFGMFTVANKSFLVRANVRIDENGIIKTYYISISINDHLEEPGTFSGIPNIVIHAMYRSVVGKKDLQDCGIAYECIKTGTGVDGLYKYSDALVDKLDNLDIRGQKMYWSFSPQYVSICNDSRCIDSYDLPISGTNKNVAYDITHHYFSGLTEDEVFTAYKGEKPERSNIEYEKVVASVDDDFDFANAAFPITYKES